MVTGYWIVSITGIVRVTLGCPVSDTVAVMVMVYVPGGVPGAGVVGSACPPPQPTAISRASAKAQAPTDFPGDRPGFDARILDTPASQKPHTASSITHVAHTSHAPRKNGGYTWWWPLSIAMTPGAVDVTTN